MSDSLLVCAALRLEVRAARAASAGLDVMRIGMRARGLAAHRPASTGPVALIGFGGGLDPTVAVGDVVVASRIVTPGGQPISCTDSDLLAELLTGAGLRVHLAPIASSDRIVYGPSRHRLAVETGAVAVDMESAPLGNSIGGRAFAVVRVVVDTPGRRLSRPTIVTDGARAYRTLREVASVLPQWAAAAGSETSTVVQQKVS